ncbi:MAG: winged helix-turn-helix domain-containing protein [Bdellovibrionales bacterium]|nr:winged helix-turn-helix domain-containing protein [Bdellovibrionales bacterium]
MGQSKIAVIEDCSSSLSMYRRIFSSLYEVSYFSSWESVVQCFENGGYEPVLFIGEIGPHIDRSLSFFSRGDYRNFFENRTLVVSACDDADVLREFFRVGVLDYLVKPINSSELLVKLERHLERDRSVFPFLKWDPRFHTVRSGEVTVSLTSKEYQIFSLLNSSGGKALAREAIVKQTWGEITVAAKSLDVHLFNLRRKINLLGLEVVFLRPHFYQLVAALKKPLAVPEREPFSEI